MWAKALGPGHPGLRTEDEATAWLATERANLHASADYAASRGRAVPELAERTESMRHAMEAPA